MAFYDKFPYTNFQELNLDWLTQEVSKVRDNRDATDASAAAALASEQAAKASETAAAASQQAAKASQQAAAGSEAASADYLAQIGTHTAGAAAEWLKENLTTTTPPVDASLTVSGAAADAKKTGDAVSDLNQALSSSLSSIFDYDVPINFVNGIEISVVSGETFNKAISIGTKEFIFAKAGSTIYSSDETTVIVAQYTEANRASFTKAQVLSDGKYALIENDCYIRFSTYYKNGNPIDSDLPTKNKYNIITINITDKITRIENDLNGFVYAVPNFVVGKQITVSGSIDNSDIGRATIEYYHALAGSRIDISNNNVIVYVAKYTSANLSDFVDLITIKGIGNTIDTDCYIRLGVKTRDHTIVSDDDINSVSFRIRVNSISDIENDIENIENDIKELQNYTQKTSFVVGAIESSYGKDSDNPARARSGFINAVKGSIVRINSAVYKIAVFEYYSDTAYYYSKNQSQLVWQNTEYVVTNDDTVYIRIVAKRNDNANISEADITAITDAVNVLPITQSIPALSVEEPSCDEYHTSEIKYDGIDDMTYAEIINAYDNLVTDHPSYVTKHELGVDSSGNYTVYQYIFEPKKPNAITLNYGGKNYSQIPTIILEAGVHGSEKPITRGLLEFATKLCNSWKTEPHIAYLRYNFRFVINPCAVPWGYENNSRFNANRVNINRNFDGMNQWQYGSDVIGNPNYRGSAPLSEVEAQYIDETLKKYKNTAILYYSFHTYGLLDAYTRMMCWAWATYVKPNEMYVAGERAIQKTSRTAWIHHNYPYSDGELIGCMQASNGDGYRGGYTCNQGNYYGIPSACPEGIYYKWNDPTTRNTHDVNCMNAEFIVNTVIEGLRALYF